MTNALRPLSPRPEVLVGGKARVVDVSLATIGVAGPLGACRMVWALPSNGVGPVSLVVPLVTVGQMSYVGDASGNILAPPNASAVWVHRMVAATKAPNTRRLG